MAYSTNNSTAISVTNFGAKGDGVSNDTNAIQNAINSLYSRGGGQILFPKSTYITSGYLHITGHNISLLGENGAKIVTTPGGNFRKLNVSGASGVSISNIVFDGGRTGTNEQYIGTVNVFSSPYFSIDNCHIVKTEGLGLSIRGNTPNVNISNNVFEDYHIGVYSDSNDISGVAPTNISIVENIFNKSWGTQPEQNYFGGIKLQNVAFESNGKVPARSYGHMILNNKFSGTNQMGIELWGYISDSAVVGNYIENSHFGISIAASSNNIVVNSNNIKACTYVGIEAADSQNVTISNNVINGATGNNYSNPVAITQEGIIINGINRNPSRASVVGNTILDCNRGIHVYNTSEVSIIGNQIILTGQNTNQNFYTTNSSYVNFSNNTLYNRTGAHFCFVLTDDAKGSTGITIANNDFIGSVQQWGIIFYSSIGEHKSAVIENNRTYAVNYCQYGMFDPGPLQSATIRNNYGQTGNLGYYIADQSIPAGTTPYANASIENGFQYYGNTSWTVPSGGITGNGIWLCLWSGGGGQQNNVRTRIANDYLVDGNYNDIELWATMSPYQSASLTNTLMATPTIWPNTAYLQAKTVAHDSSTISNSVWVKLSPTTTGAAGATFSINYSKANGLASPYATYAEPPNTTNNANLVFAAPLPFPGAYKFYGGINLGGNGAVHLNTSSSGVLQLFDPSSYEYGPKLTFGKRVADTTIGLYEDVPGQGYGIGIGPLQMRLHVGDAPAKFSFLNQPNGREIFTIKGSGMVGINHPNPSFALHVSGDVCLSGIATSTTANIGGATLPANPVGFVTINITGGNFKIPYYNV